MVRSVRVHSRFGQWLFCVTWWCNTKDTWWSQRTIYFDILLRKLFKFCIFDIFMTHTYFVIAVATQSSFFKSHVFIMHGPYTFYVYLFIVYVRIYRHIGFIFLYFFCFVPRIWIWMYAKEVLLLFSSAFFHLPLPPLSLPFVLILKGA